MIRLVKTLAWVVYGLYSWLVFLLLADLALLLMVFTPGVERRRAVARWTALAALGAVGIRISVQRSEYLPADHCVVVANHTSYVDGLVLTAALPPRFAFVIKKEMKHVPFAGWLLQLIGSEFVERFNRHKGAMDARRIVRRARGGESLVFFPEGTFSKQPGLLRFHTGAFVTAVRAGSRIAAVAIRGARQVLPWYRIFPIPGVIKVDVVAILEPIPDHGDAAALLRDESRRVLLTELGEPDLAASADAATLASDAA